MGVILADILQSGVFGADTQHLATWSLWLITAGSAVLLLVGADRAVGAAVKLAKAVHIPTVVIGATVVSLGTTMPEACVSVMAAFKGEPGLALANGVGSIICDTALIFGLCCLLTRLPLDRFVLRRHGVLQLAAGTLLTVVVFVSAWLAGFGDWAFLALAVLVLLLFGYMCLLAWVRLPGRAWLRWALVAPVAFVIGLALLQMAVSAMLALAYLGSTRWSVLSLSGPSVVIPRWIGLVFLALLVGYMYVSFRWARQHPEMIPAEARQSANRVSAGTVALMLGLLGLGLALVLTGSDMLIGAVLELGFRYKVPRDVLGVTVVAFGTSLPELATALAAIKRGHPELLVGNIIGADILNVLFVVGAAATASPLSVPPLFFTLHLPVMMVALLLLRFYIFTSGKSFKRWQGIPLLALYVLYVARLVMLRQY